MSNFECHCTSLLFAVIFFDVEILLNLMCSKLFGFFNLGGSVVISILCYLQIGFLKSDGSPGLSWLLLLDQMQLSFFVVEQ